MPERPPSSACSSSTLRGDLQTSAPGAYLPAVSASGTCAYRHAARAARRPDTCHPRFPTILPASSIMQTLVSLTETSNPIAHAALLLLMLEAAGADLVYHQPEAQHPNVRNKHDPPCRCDERPSVHNVGHPSEACEQFGCTAAGPAKR